MSGSALERALGEPVLADTTRIAVSRARRRILYGLWQEDAIERIHARLGAIRRDAVGYPDLSANPFRSVCHQTAVLYDREPRLSHPDDDAERTLARALERKLRAAAWSSKAQRWQRDTLGIRELLVRPDVSSSGRLVLRSVFPDRCDVEPDDEEPDRPGVVREARARRHAGAVGWTYDEIDPSRESYVVTDGTGRTITAETIGGKASGEAYPYRWASGDPWLPYVLYHATPTGELWDYTELRELYDATLESCVLWTFWSHCVRDASWPQRYVVDLTVRGATTEGPAGAPRQAVTTDPASLLQLTRTTADAAGSPLPPGQFASGSDPLALAEALMIYEQRLASYVGITDPEFIRRGGDPRSGYALMISRDGQRAASRKFEPQFRVADEELLAKCAALLNRHGESVGWLDDSEVVPELPETGWRIRYLGLPLTPDEQRARREEVLALLDRGLISRTRAYAILHELDDDEAARELAEIDEAAREARAEQAATGAPAPGETAPGAPGASTTATSSSTGSTGG